MNRAIAASSADTDILWFAVPPGFQDLFVEAGLNAGKHIIVEKPWMCSAERTLQLLAAAGRISKQVAVHFQYCFLDSVREIALRGQEATVFSGAFCISRGNRLSLDPLYNLGSHLVAIKCLYFKNARIGTLVTGYDMPDRRSITIETDSTRIDIDLLETNEPLVTIYRCIRRKHLCRNQLPEYILHLALEVARQLEAIRPNDRCSEG